MYSFLLIGGKHKIKRNTVIGPYDQGGLKIIHIVSQNQALKLGWIKRLISNESKGTCKEFMLHILPVFFFENIWKCNISI